MLTRYLALCREWFFPAEVGAYYDGERFHLAEDLRHPGRRPARVFVAVSHRLLLFQALKLPRNLDEKARQGAAALEARRIFSLLQGRAPGELSCAVLPRRADEVLIVFQEKEVLQGFCQDLAAGLVFCGAVPAGVAVLGYFWQKDRRLPEGVYYVRTPQAYEGAVVKGGRLVDLLPASPSAAEAFLEAWEGEVFTAEGQAEEILAQGARALSALPREYALSFDNLPLRLRPRPSLPLLILWLLPLFILGASQVLRYETHRLETRTQTITKKIQALKASFAEIETFQEKKVAFQKIQETLEDWQAHRVDLVAVITRLSVLFPEDTWVRRLEFRGPNELRLWAEGQNALEILKLLDADPMFTEVKFLSTVTKNTRNGKEVFSLVLKIVSENGDAPKSKSKKRRLP